MIRNLKEVKDNNFDITRDAEEVRNLSFKDHICIGCGICESTCPVEAIAEGTPYVVDAATCTDCGACEGACPVGAIVAE